MVESQKVFERNGYLVIPNALSMEEVHDLNTAIDGDREISPLWQNRGGGRHQNPNILLTSNVFDRAIRHPSVIGLVETLLGEDACFDEHSVMIREPVDSDPPAPKWHRDTDHLPEHRFALRSLSLVYYLTDVDEGTHCFCVVPESVVEKQGAPKTRDGSGAVDLHGRAGTAILFNAGSVHDARQCVTERERRTIHIYYGHASLPALSKNTIIPKRLTQGSDGVFYQRLNAVSARVHSVFE